MTVTEKMRHHVDENASKGVYIPGELLPSYHEFCGILGVSYASVQKALRSLEEEGTVELVHGVGTYLSGKSPLAIDLYLNPNNSVFSEIGAILNHELNRQKIHAKVRVFARGDLDHSYGDACQGIRLVDWGVKYFDTTELPYPIHFSEFSDYESTLKGLKPFPRVQGDSFIPYGIYGNQFAVNPAILKAGGVTLPGAEYSGINWWAELLHSFEKANLPIGAKYWNTCGCNSIGHFFFLLYCLGINQHEKADGFCRLPLFETKAGELFLGIVNNLEFIKGSLVL